MGLTYVCMTLMVLAQPVVEIYYQCLALANHKAA